MLVPDGRWYANLGKYLATSVSVTSLTQQFACNYRYAPINSVIIVDTKESYKLEITGRKSRLTELTDRFEIISETFYKSRHLDCPREGCKNRSPIK